MPVNFNGLNPEFFTIDKKGRLFARGKSLNKKRSNVVGGNFVKN